MGFAKQLSGTGRSPRSCGISTWRCCDAAKPFIQIPNAPFRCCIKPLGALISDPAEPVTKRVTEMNSCSLGNEHPDLDSWGKICSEKGKHIEKDLYEVPCASSSVVPCQ